MTDYDWRDLFPDEKINQEIKRPEQAIYSIQDIQNDVDSDEDLYDEDLAGFSY